MSRANRAILIAVVALLAAIPPLAYLNRGDAALKRALQESRRFLLKVEGETAAVVGLQDLLDMEVGNFTTRLSTSASAPRDADFQGVELRLIYEHFGVDVSEAAVYDVRGLDGFHSPLAASEVAAERAIYICFAMDGDILPDSGNGGWGPFLMVVRDAPFAQRWCKYVEEIDARH
jgi:hypothetical protein